MPIQWREQMSVGIKSIDDDHRQLVTLVNQFEELAHQNADLNGRNESLVRTLLGQLQAYTAEHFQREERIQQEANYPGIKENAEHHRALTKEMQVMVDRYTQGSSEGGKPLTAADMSAFLNSWLVNHIIKVDLKMRNFKFPGRW